MKISEQEFLYLITHSDREHVVQGTFSPHWVTVPDIGWEADAVLMLRKSSTKTTFEVT